MIGFRNHLGLDWPSDNAFLAGVERLLDDRDSEFLIGSPHDDAPPGGVVQLRYRWGIWRAGFDCLLEDLFVVEDARRYGLGRALVESAIARPRGGCTRGSGSSTTATARATCTTGSTSTRGRTREAPGSRGARAARRRR